MISYQPFYETLLRENITEYALIFKHGIPANTLHRMKHGKPITTTTLDTLCSILNCSVSDILNIFHQKKYSVGNRGKLSVLKRYIFILCINQ